MKARRRNFLLSSGASSLKLMHLRAKKHLTSFELWPLFARQLKWHLQFMFEFCEHIDEPLLERFDVNMGMMPEILFLCMVP